MESYQLRLRLGVELEMKERALQRRVVRKFSKIKGHSKEEIYPDVFVEQEKVLENITRRIVEPCERITEAQGRVASLQRTSKAFAAYLKQIRGQSLREAREHERRRRGAPKGPTKPSPEFGANPGASRAVRHLGITSPFRSKDSESSPSPRAQIETQQAMSSKDYLDGDDYWRELQRKRPSEAVANVAALA